MRQAQVLVVADHEAVRAWLRRIVERHPDLSLTGAVPTLRDAVVLARSLRPDVVVLDDRLPEIETVVACRRLLAVQPRAAVVLLTSLDDEHTDLEQVLSGAAGVVLRGADPELVAATLVEAVPTDVRPASVRPGGSP